MWVQSQAPVSGAFARISEFSDFSRIACQVRTSPAARGMVWLLATLMLPALTGCGGAMQSEGSVALHDNSGTPYSFAGATATLYSLNAAAVTPGQARTEIGTGIVEAEGSAVTLRARRSAVRDARLYAVEFRCPANAPDDECDVDAPLHAVLTGAQLVAGSWRASALTEAAFHSVAYAVAAGYSAADVQTVLDGTAVALSSPDAFGESPAYADLLTWNASDTAAVLRAGFLDFFSEQLAAGANSNTIKVLAQQWIQPLIGWQDLNNIARDVAVVGQYAFVLDGAPDQLGFFQVVDISNPAQPERVASLPEMGNLMALQVVGNLAYVVEGRGAPAATPGVLHIIDLSDPLQPQPLAQVDIPGFPRALEIAGDLALVTLGSAGLQIINVANPQAPVAAGYLPADNQFAGLAISDSMAYITGVVGLYQIDFSNPAQPVLVRSMVLGGVGPIAIAGQYAYTTGYTWGEDYEYGYDDSDVIRVIDISNPTWPIVGAVQSSGYATRLTLQDDRLYATGPGFLNVIDVSNPFLLRQVGQLQLDAVGHWIEPDGLIYITNRDGDLEIHDARIVERSPLLAGHLAVAGGVSRRTTAGSGYAYSPRPEYVADMFDLTDPLAPQFLRLFRGAEKIGAIVPFGQYGFLVDDETGYINVLDLSDPWRAMPVSGLHFSGTNDYDIDVRTIVPVGDYVYISFNYLRWEDGLGTEGEYGGLAVVDFQNPAAPQALARYETSPITDALALGGDFAYLGLQTGSVEVIDIHDPLTPAAIASVSVPVPAQALAVSGTTLYAAAGETGLHLIDVSEPAAATVRASLDTPGFASAIALIDGYAYVGDGVGGVQVATAADPAAPVLQGAADTRGVVRTVFEYEGWLYAGTSYGLEVLKALPASTPASAPAPVPAP